MSNIRFGNEGNEYLVAFFEKNNIKIGDPYTGYQFQEWINAKHDEFRKFMGMPLDIELNDEEEKLFVRFLNNGSDVITEEERSVSIQEYKKVEDMIHCLSGD